MLREDGKARAAVYFNSIKVADDRKARYWLIELAFNEFQGYLRGDPERSKSRTVRKTPTEKNEGLWREHSECIINAGLQLESLIPHLEVAHPKYRGQTLPVDQHRERSYGKAQTGPNVSMSGTPVRTEPGKFRNLVDNRG
ncbi:hypothetical protein B0H13DRAFT_1908429 [Mycena leptocephala]|nr:hypothetical protein B0H13DRAFT_1908429 [Mycena leptocephala]